jgi:hypothetical protein
MAKRRHKKKRPMPVVRIGEMATPERRRKLGGLMTEVVDRDASGKAYIKRQRARIECMLDYYFQNYRLDDPQYMAGLKYREIYLRVNFDTNCKILSNPFLMQAGQGDHEGKMHAHIDCLRQLNEVYALLTVPQQTILRDVCGHDQATWGTNRNQTLLRALDILAVHWGYAAPKKPSTKN